MVRTQLKEPVLEPVTEFISEADHLKTGWRSCFHTRPGWTHVINGFFLWLFEGLLVFIVIGQRREDQKKTCGKCFPGADLNPGLCMGITGHLLDPVG